MNRLLFSIGLTFALAAGANAATDTFLNQGTNYYGPGAAPQIDATNFVNTGQFVLNISSPLAFSFSDVLNYTNRGLMVCNTGFTFDTEPSGSGSPRPALLFGNANNGTILSGALSDLTVKAKKIVNAGTISGGDDGLLTLEGDDIDITRGTLSIGNLVDVGGLVSFSTSLSSGFFDEFWGLGTQTNVIQTQGAYTLPNPHTPRFAATDSLYRNFTNQLFLQNAIAKANVVQIDASNVVTQVVFVGNATNVISTDVRFEADGFGPGPTIPVVEIKAFVTNNVGIITTNTIYFSDSFAVSTNFFLLPFQGSQIGATLFIPTNYDIETGFPGYDDLPMGNTPYDPSLLPLQGQGITNQYSAFGVDVEPVTFRPDPNVPGQNLTNIPGRLVIDAKTNLDLTRAIINGPNYLRLTSTNHFKGSVNAQISSPNVDINLGSTNGMLGITNLVAPYLPRFVGTVDAYSARWTNVVNGITNQYHILMVATDLSPKALPLVQNLLLRSPNVVINDLINVATNILINAQSVTIATNAPGSPNPYGQLNLLTPNVIWTASFPTLEFFTNYGILNVPNAVFFAETEQAPYFTSNLTASYQAFVNHGSIVTSGNTTWANYFESTSAGLTFTNAGGLPITTNESVIYSTFGPINIQAATALIANDIMSTAAGDVSITAGNLTIINHTMQVQGALSLTVTNQLVDGGVASSNFWYLNNGFNLRGSNAPLQGDLLGTTVTNFCPAGFQVFNTWSGTNKGAIVAGFQNNGAVGHLILDGGSDTSDFYFNGVNSTTNAMYAMYVDLLDLRNGATNRSDVNNVEVFTSLDFDSNMTIYYADALLGGFDVSEKMNGANGGHLIWVSSYAGIFSSTNLVDSNGQTNMFNRALAQSTDIDSDGDGMVNAFDPMPFGPAPAPVAMSLAVSFANMPQKTPVVTFNTLANTTYSLYYRTNMSGANWQLVTNFTPSLVNSNMTYIDHGRTNSSGFYKVVTGAGQP